MPDSRLERTAAEALAWLSANPHRTTPLSAAIREAEAWLEAHPPPSPGCVKPHSEQDKV